MGIEVFLGEEFITPGSLKSLEMAKGKENSKAAEKKKERIALQRKMDARIAIVKTANQQEDPLASLPSFKVFKKNGLEATLSTIRVASLEPQDRDCAIDLLI